ncbi:ATP12 family chaperone protein [Aestuariivirga sp.]|uniref:ATP12 family chaperone protein n=1 Tax=Aestuariivirga sp. TaxID=2650926 RepID=UPI0039E31B60
MKRFYKEVTVTPGNGIALDGKAVKTPAKLPLVLPTPALAEAIAAEWLQQGETINPHSMHLTKLANTAIDRIAPDHHPALQEIVDYAGSDLICYRADRPPELIARQKAAWDPVMDWALSALDAPFEQVVGVTHHPQPPEALRAVGTAIKSCSAFEIAALHTLTTLTGSALLSLMLFRQAADEEAVWSAAHVDEDYQIAQWGEDHEAKQRRMGRHAEFLACARFLRLLSG